MDDTQEELNRGQGALGTQERLLRNKGSVAGGSPLKDSVGGPVNMGVMPKTPGIA